MIAPLDFDWDDALIDAARHGERARARVYCPSQTVVVLGRGSKPEIEVKVDAVQKDGIPLLRRRGGGCSVVLDRGNVIASVALPLPGLGGIPRAFGEISRWLIASLDVAGVPDVYQVDTSDLVLDNRKIGGACIYRTRGMLYYSTTLLFRPDLELVERYLRHPPREPDYRSGRSHSEFMGSIAESTHLTDIDAFAGSVDMTLHDSLAGLESSLAPRENHTINTIEVFS